MESTTEMPTLGVLKELPEIAKCKSLDGFAILVLMSSILGRTVRCSLQHNISKPFSPWDFRSDFARISSILLAFENMLTLAGEQITFARFAIYDGYDRQKAGHFVWSRGVYHLCGCLLNHPFLLLKYRHQYSPDFPHTFAKESLDRCRRHAAHLTTILHSVQTRACCARGSFLGYIATVAASIHCMFEQSTDEEEKRGAAVSVQMCLDFLEQPPACWKNYKRMVSSTILIICAPATSELFEC